MRATRNIIFVVGLFCAAFVATQALADDRDDRETDGKGDRVDALFGGDYFGAGASPGPSGPVEGDAFLAGGEITLNHRVAGDAALSGGSIHVGQQIGADLYAAGGDILVNAGVGHNARLAGGRVHVTRHADVAGRMTIAASRIRVEGSVGGALAVYGDSVVIDGVISDEVAVVARKLEVGPNARIEGRLTYRTRQAPQISPQAVISGGMQQSSLSFPEARLEPVARAAFWVGLAMFTSGLFLVGLLILLLAPHASAVLVSELRSRPVASFLLGFALVVCIPVAAVLAMLSLIGIPLGLALLFIWPLTILLGYLAGVIFCADALAARLSRARPPGRTMRMLGLAIVLIAVILLSRLFVIGPLLILLLLFSGTGALVLAIRNAVR